jgi:hypothetical protein
MTRLRADLRISSPQSDRIDLVLTVHTAFQHITEWNRAFWDLEMATCESVLLRGDQREAEWTEFMRAHRKAAIIWTLTCSLGGRRFPQKADAKTNGGNAARAACAECSGLSSIQDLISYGGVHVCARCKPVFLQKLTEGAKMMPGSAAARNHET